MDYDRLVKQHKDAVYRQMVRACGNHDDAEDVLVEALLAAYRALPNIRDENAFQGWLAVVGRRVCSRIQKHEALRPVLSLSGLGEEIEVADSRQDPVAESDQEELAMCVKKAVANLPEALRDVYLRREIEGKPAEETAVGLGITVAAVKSRLHRARQSVRKSLDQSVCLP
jgi:RNA polymerase sigma-70 factor (ECF subfamily)